MIMMPYGWAWSSLQLTGQANFWHPTCTTDHLGSPAGDLHKHQTPANRPEEVQCETKGFALGACGGLAGDLDALGPGAPPSLAQRPGRRRGGMPGAGVANGKVADSGVINAPGEHGTMTSPTVSARETPIMRGAGYGILAPNPHNTQAWRIRPVSATQLLLYVDERRLLPETDPPARQIHIGCGCFIETLAVGMSAHGYATSVDYLPEGSHGRAEAGRKPVARITLREAPAGPADDLAEFRGRPGAGDPES